MNLHFIDWLIISGFFLITLIIGLSVYKKAGANSEEFFLSGRNMPWWLLGISMVATTFSADTPNLVTDIVRKNGVSGNWVWWAFLITGMLTVFVYAKLWRRSAVMTDLEFYELRYSGPVAAFLRGFRAIYLGVIFNIVIMASVTLAAIKIGGVLMGISPLQTVLIASIITVTYAALGGLKGVLLTDFFQFIIAMAGSVWACIIIVNMPEVGGLENLLNNELVRPKLDMLPDFYDPSIFVPAFMIPLLIQWWSVWYPGAEPGGGGYIAQRMFAARDEKGALLSTLLFNVAHYALRPWPWILIALASLIVFPTHDSIQVAFPHISADIINDDLAYPAMLSRLPAGVLGLVLASLIAAFMSTISTHLNWGSSYISNDVYKRFVKPDASEKEQVQIGRWSTVLLMIASSALALMLSSALQAFEILLQIGAGTGLLFILRWFWWRINAYSEIAAMIGSFVFALILEFGPFTFPFYLKLILGVGLTTLSWIMVTLWTSPENTKTLSNFYNKIRPHHFGWNTFLKQQGITKLASGNFTAEISGIILGCTGVYGFLFASGNLIYGNYPYFAICLLISITSFYFLRKKIWPIVGK
jgi:solute:Na+ symporter, SSS family